MIILICFKHLFSQIFQLQSLITINIEFIHIMNEKLIQNLNSFFILSSDIMKRTQKH
jgi:hypothetical protein